METNYLIILVVLCELVGFISGLLITILINDKLKKELKLEREINELKEYKIRTLKEKLKEKKNE